jgi:hypothetical protein
MTRHADVNLFGVKLPHNAHGATVPASGGGQVFNQRDGDKTSNWITSV